MDCRTSSGSTDPVGERLGTTPAPTSGGAEETPPFMGLSGPNSTRQRGAACTNTGSMKAASIIAGVHRPLRISHDKITRAKAASAIKPQRPALMIARGLALRIQLPILIADTSNES